MSLLNPWKSPPRLLYTHNGMLCDRNSQTSDFENSHEFNQLMLSVSTLDNSPPVTCSTSFEHRIMSYTETSIVDSLEWKLVSDNKIILFL